MLDLDAREHGSKHEQPDSISLRCSTNLDLRLSSLNNETKRYHKEHGTFRKVLYTFLSGLALQ